MLGSHDTVAMRPPSKAVRHRDGGCEEAILGPRVRVGMEGRGGCGARCDYHMGRRGEYGVGVGKRGQCVDGVCEEVLYSRVWLSGL